MQREACTRTRQWMDSSGESWQRPWRGLSQCSSALSFHMERLVSVFISFEFSHGDIRQEAEKHLQSQSLIKMGPSLSTIIPLECLFPADLRAIFFFIVDNFIGLFVIYLYLSTICSGTAAVCLSCCLEKQQMDKWHSDTFLWFMLWKKPMEFLLL